MTSRLAAYIISNLSDVRSFTSVAREVNLSVSTVIRVFDCVNYGKPKRLPKVVSIDEFKGNTFCEIKKMGEKDKLSRIASFTL